MAMPLTTANWHWKNKNVSNWAKTWFERELVTVSLGDKDGEAVSVSTVDHVSGDVELGQRKSKLITIYDCKIELSWVGKASDGTEVKGKLTVPEVSHEVTLDGLSDYVYEWSLTTASSPAVNALYAHAKKNLPPALEKVFASFPGAMLETHGKDLQVQSPSASGASTPVPAGMASSSTNKAFQAASAGGASTKAKPVNTSTVKTEATFMAASDDLFSLLTDEARIPSWTRAPATSKPEAGAAYSLFAGGVKGSYVELTPGKKIVQTWALSSPSWPSGHEATLTTTLEQSSDSTKVTFNLAGVPKGMEDEIQRNLEGYYVHGLKSIGYVQLTTFVPSSPHPSSPVRRSTKAAAAPEEAPSSNAPYIAVFFGILALGAAFVPYFYK